MEIISISLDNDTLAELGRAQKALGFTSRSKLIRATIGSLVNEYRAMDSLKGEVDAVFTLTYRHSHEHALSDIFHSFEDCIRTAVHQHHAGICLNVLIVSAGATRVRELFGLLKKAKGLRSMSVSVL